MGFVGTAINAFFAGRLPTVQYDKYKGIGKPDDLLPADLIYLCLPTLCTGNTYDTKELCYTFEYLSENSYNGVVLVKSTVLPGYLQQMNNKYPGLKLVANPEFLSAATAAEDFATQRHIVLGFTEQSEVHCRSIIDFYATYFPEAEISYCDATSAALVKLGCNGFYATKIQYFTELKLLCDKSGVDYLHVRKMMLRNGWINEMHTRVPGHDGQVSFGGACLPKDIKAMTNFARILGVPNAVITAVYQEQQQMRE
jgi:UDPglucose 6-dehydrogenase